MNIAENYRQYLELGGIINEDDYRSAINRMSGALDREEPSVRASISQAKDIAKYAGIKLSGPEDGFDPRIALYVILRLDVRPEGVEYHHDQMSDQRVFAEVLRMMGDKDSLDKLIKAHPHMSFEYKREPS